MKHGRKLVRLCLPAFVASINEVSKLIFHHISLNRSAKQTMLFFSFKLKPLINEMRWGEQIMGLSLPKKKKLISYMNDPTSKRGATL